jgi:hypothetical protein
MTVMDVPADDSLAIALNSILGADAGWTYREHSESAKKSLALAEVDDRSVAVHRALHTFLLDFSREVQLAHGAVDDTALIVEATRLWLGGADLTGLKRAHPFVEFTELQLGYERGDARETQWRILLADENQMYRDVIALAAADPLIRDCFPAVGHNLLFFADGFSSAPLASVVFWKEWLYRLYIPGGDSAVVVGDAATVIARLSSILAESRDRTGD